MKNYISCRVALILVVAVIVASFGQALPVQADGVSEEQARAIANARVLQSPIFPEFENAALGSVTTFTDLGCALSAYVFVVDNGGRGVGYVTVSASRSFYPIFEASTGSPPASNLAKARQLVDQQWPSDQIVGESPIYLGTLDYFVSFTLTSGREIYVSLKTLAPVSQQVLRELETRYEEARQKIQAQAQFAWSQVHIQQVEFAKVDPDPSTDTDRYAYTWYRGCGPTSATMLLSWYAKTRGYFSGLDYPLDHFNWDGPGADPRDIPRPLADELADQLGFPASGGDDNDYGANDWQLGSAINDVARDHGYVVYGDGTVFAWNLIERYREEIDANREFVLGLSGHPVYGDHFTAAYGYRYDDTGHMIYIFDTWDRAEHSVNLDNLGFMGYSAVFVHADGNISNGNGEQLEPNSSIEKAGERVDSHVTNYYTFWVDATVSHITVPIDGAGWGFGPVSYGYDPRYLIALYKQGQQKPDEVLTSDGNFLHDWSAVIDNDSYERIVVAVSARGDAGQYILRVEPSDAVPNILAPTSEAPDLVGANDNPHKLQVDVEVKTDEGTLISGLGRDDFNVRIGAADAGILTMRELSDRYVLEVQPPAQPSDGSYDLMVTVFGNSDTEAEAVQYASLAQTNIDTVLVIDRSGSMSGTPIQNARDSAKLFVDLMNNQDMISVVSFSSYSRIDFPLTTITSTVTQDTARSVIDTIYAGGNTSIGAGLRDGRDELTGKGNANHPWSIVLLSDGQENTAPWVSDILPGIVSTKIKVFSIGLGSVDEALMQDIAYQTGGQYYYTPSDTQLAEIYSAISGQVAGRQTLYSASNSVSQGQTDTEMVHVDQSVTEAIFSLSWTNGASDLDLTLRTPSGRDISPQTAQSDPNVEFVSGPTYEYYKVYQPESDDWLMFVHGSSVTSLTFDVSSRAASQNYNLVTQARTNLTLDVVLDKGGYSVGEPINLQVSLTDNDLLTEARVTAQVGQPTGGVIDTLILYDDGMHADGWAGNGVYANFYSRTSMPGSYQFTVKATGRSSLGDTFQRLVTLSAAVVSGTDADGDGMLDVWEDAVGLNRTVNDSADDPDNDGLTNLEEFRNGTDSFTADTDRDELGDGEEVNTYGTNPTNADTDLGGEPDGSEVAGGRNPLDPSDDRIAAIYLPVVLRNYGTSAPTWSLTTGLSAHTVYALASDPSNCTIRYAGADNGMYKSTNTGSAWAATSLSGPMVSSVAVDPTASQTIYAATWGQGVYKSANGGASWSQVNAGFDDKLWLYALAVALDGSLYAGTHDSGVYKSAAGGAWWSAVNNGLGNLNVRALAADPNNGQIIYAGTTAGVYRTGNGGGAWSPASSGLPGGTVWWLTVHPANSLTVFAGTAGGMYRSTDGGGSWSLQGLAGQAVYATAVDPLATQTIYAGTNGSGVYRSADGGMTWAAMNTGLGNLNVQSLALDGGTCHALQAGTVDGVWTYR